MAIYEKIVNPALPFKDFFVDFWDKVIFDSPHPSGGPSGDRPSKNYSEHYEGDEKVKEAIKKFDREKIEIKTSEELLLAAKENYVDKIYIISSYNEGKPGMIAGAAKQKKQ
ncbi:11272_t:CDS:2 [Entrophospora sp. SA101]|nr:12687_t:CDS:2 [Entrophospora sp. SA101]CAJ0869230.1 11272_t:CDS:2 [Entrophospora sp. SA101]CAJ0914594.1 1311_t:CDS:2 [Entrophospora sp. SA101]